MNQYIKISFSLHLFIRFKNASEGQLENASKDQLENASDDRLENASDDRLENASDDRLENASDDRLENASDDRLENASDDRLKNVLGDRLENVSEDRAGRALETTNELNSLIEVNIMLGWPFYEISSKKLFFLFFAINCNINPIYGKLNIIN